MKRQFYADAQAFLGFPGEPPRIEEGLQLDLALVTCAPPMGLFANSIDATLEAIGKFHVALTMQKKSVRIVEIEHDLDEDRPRFVFGLQNLPEDVNSRSRESFVRLWNKGVRVISLAYDKANLFGSGCLNIDIGLTPDGARAIRWMNELGFILDLSHTSHRTAREALELVDRENLNISVMASHGGCYSVYPHFRNLPDDVLAAIAKRGGVVGIAQLTFILHQEDNSLDPFHKHLARAISLCGEEHVVIGSDAPYVPYLPEQEYKLFHRMKAMIDPNGTWGSRSPSYIPIWKGLRSHERLSLLKGISEGVLGGNLLNFFKRSLPQ